MEATMRYTEMAERSRAHHHQHIPRSTGQGFPHHRQAFHHARTSLGAAGHLLHMGMAAAPFLIAEYIPDPEKKWRAMRAIPVIGALASEALWTMKIAHDRKREQEDHAQLDACYDRSR
jgi:hypothetical protein